MKNDQYVVEAISKGEIKVKTFDYDGKKYKVSDAIVLLQNITADISSMEQKIADYHQEIHYYFQRLADVQGKRSEFDEKYEDLVAFNSDYEAGEIQYNEMVKNTAFLYQALPFSDIESKISDLKTSEEKFKKHLAVLLELPDSKDNLEQGLFDSLVSYTNSEQLYFYVDRYNEENLKTLLSAISMYKNLLEDNHFAKKKYLLNFMLVLDDNKGKDSMVNVAV